MRHSLILYLMVCLSTLLVPVSAVITSDTNVQVLNIAIPEQGLQCMKQFMLLTDLKNDGKSPEPITVNVLNQPLHVNELSPLTVVEAGRINSFAFLISLPEEPEGTYEFEVLVTAGQKITRLFKSFTFAGCEEQTERQVMPTIKLNPSATKKAPEEASGNLLLVATIGIVCLLLIIIIIYLIRNAKEA